MAIRVLTAKKLNALPLNTIPRRSFAAPTGKGGNGKTKNVRTFFAGPRALQATLGSAGLANLPVAEGLAVAGKLLAKYKLLSAAAGGAVVVSVLDALKGEANDFYDYRFITEKVGRGGTAIPSLSLSL